MERVEVLLDLGLGYLALGRGSTTLSPGEAQRLRIATQLRSGLFGVVYVLDEPSAGLHPADAVPLLDVLDRLKGSGNSLFVVEHDLDVVRRADWIVDIGPGAGEAGGRVLYSGPVAGLEDVEASVTAAHLFGRAAPLERHGRTPHGWLHLRGVTRHNLSDLSVDLPLCVMTAVTGVSGSGKSTLVTQVLAELVRRHLGQAPDDAEESELEIDVDDATGLESFDRLVRVDQRPIGRTPRSNLATYTGLFDAVRKVFAATPAARERGYGIGRFSFNVPEGRCETCQGEGSVSVELLFLPGTHAPCPTCHGARYNAETLEITWHDLTIADVLGLTVERAAEVLAEVPAAVRSSRPCARWGWDTCGWGSRRPSSAAARRSASSSRPSCSGPDAGTRSTSSTSPRPGSTRPTRPCCCASSTASSTPATRWCSSSTTSTRSPRPTGSSTWARAAATGAGGWWRPGPLRRSRQPPAA